MKPIKYVLLFWFYSLAQLNLYSFAIEVIKYIIRVILSHSNGRQFYIRFSKMPD